MRLIDADALKESVHAHDYVLKDCLNSTDKGMFTVGIMQAIDEQPTVDAVPVIRCKDCKHRPVYDEQKREMPPMLNIEYDEDGEPWIWDDDMTCPYLCGDSYYNQMPDDEQFCDRGERKEE